MEFASYILEGFIHGFDTKVANSDVGIQECKNLLSALRNQAAVDELLSTEVEKGFLFGPYKTPPFKQYSFFSWKCRTKILQKEETHRRSISSTQQ